MSKTPERRRIVVIDEAMQRRMILAFMWPTTLTLTVTALVLVVLAVRLHTTAAEAGVMLDNVGSGIASVLVFLMAASAFGLFHALKLSHRVAGPAYRLRETLRAVREGDLRVRARLRDGDYLVQTAAALNEFLDWLERHPPSKDETTPQGAAADVAGDGDGDTVAADTATASAVGISPDRAS